MIVPSNVASNVMYIHVYIYMYTCMCMWNTFFVPFTLSFIIICFLLVHRVWCAAGIQTTSTNAQYSEQFVIMFTLVMTQLKQVHPLYSVLATSVVGAILYDSF